MILAMFRDEAALQHALHRFRAESLGPVESYTPAPLQDADSGSPIPVIIMLAGLLGAAASFALQSWSYTVAYRFDIGGRPQFAWASFIPTAFENGVLLAVAAGFFAYFILNRMPRLHAPVDEADMFREASRDGWFLALHSTDAGTVQTAHRLLRDLQPARVEELAGC